MNKEEDDSVPIVKLCDFGLSHIKDEKTGKIFMAKKSGSHSYIAPEVTNVSVFNTKTDSLTLIIGILSD